MQTGQTENAVNAESKCRQGRQKMQTGQTENAARADSKHTSSLIIQCINIMS